MANRYLIRSAKSGNDWTTNDLLAYNIKVSSQSPDKFYGQPLPPVESLSSIDPNLLAGTLGTQGVSDETYRLLQYLDLASKANAGQDSAVDDVAKEILRALDYEKRGLLLRSRYAIPGPRAIAENPWSRSGQKKWTLGPRAGGQSGQKATKFEVAQSSEPGQDQRNAKRPKASIRT